MPLSLLSPEFFAFSFGTGILLSALLGPVRQALFLAANLLFLWWAAGSVGVSSTILFIWIGYALTRLLLNYPRWFVPALVGYALLFVYMRRYSFFGWVLPADLLGITFSTIGLSFLFFKIVHVMIEAHSGTLGELTFPTYMNYCLMFTTFLSGPIQRYQDYVAQWEGRELALPPTFEAHLDAVLRVLVGLVKAFVFAERLSPLLIPESSDRLSTSLGGTLINVYAYFFYLYFNFSGYCDIVIGVGSLIGIRPPENFDNPFLARNISDYWSRWHRSLTIWLTSYVFSPTYRWFLTHSWFGQRPLLSMNLGLLLTMIVSGVWHGTTLNFLLWGIAHGCYLILFRTWEAGYTYWFGKTRLRTFRRSWAAQAIGIVLTFHVVAFTLILFRFEAPQALRILASLGDVQLTDCSFLTSIWHKLM